MSDTTREHLEAELIKFREALDHLKIHRSTTSLAKFRKNPDTYFAVCYLFVIIIEALVDIGQLVLVIRGKRAESQRDVAMLLAREQIISEVLGQRLRDIVGFRNILIHVYPNLDDAKVASYLQNNLDDFDAFLVAVMKTMDP